MSDTTCRLCGGADFDVITETLRHDVARRALACKGCGLVFLEPTAEGDLDEYYRGDYRAKHSPVIGRGVTPAEHYDLVAPFQRERAAALAEFMTPTTRLLEIGASSGSFLGAVKPMVQEAIGLELNAADVEHAREKTGCVIVDRPLSEAGLEPHSFDVVCLFEVLEHIPEPEAMLNEIRTLLKPGGMVLVEVPNHDDGLLSWEKAMGYRQFYYRVPHLYYFTGATLSRMAAECGFTPAVRHLQQYGFFNHLRWEMTGAPTPSITEARAPYRPDVAGPLAEKLNAFFDETDARYRALLKEAGATDMILLVGRNDG